MYDPSQAGGGGGGGGGGPYDCERPQELCRVVDEATGQPCCESLQILRQFDKLYRSRITQVEEDQDAEDVHKNELKLKIMSDWVKDLEDQNAMLVKTVHELEQAAVCRVKLLENKLLETSHLMSQNMSHPNKSVEELNVLSKRVCQLECDQSNMQDRIRHLQNDIKNLLELIKRGRIENNWNLDGLTFHEIQPSEIPAPDDCTCGQITGMIENEESSSFEKDLEIEKLRGELHNTVSEMNMMNIRMHDYKDEVNDLQMNIEKKCKENNDLVARLARLEKESFDSREALTGEVAQQHNSLWELRDEKIDLQSQLEESKMVIKFKNEMISQLKDQLKELNKQKVPNATRRVRVCTEPYQKVQDISIEDRLRDATKQLEESENLLVSKDNEIIKLRTILSERSNQENQMDEKSLQNVSAENQNEIVSYLTNLLSSMKKDKEIILSLKNEYESVLNNLKQTKDLYLQDTALANEILQEMESYMCTYQSEVINKEQSKNIKEFITTIETKINYIQKLFKNNCEMCIRENLLSKIKEMTLQVTSGIQKLSEIHDNKIKLISLTTSMITQNNIICNRNNIDEIEQRAIFTAIQRQVCMMEEFRICTVEVQAATEDLREEVSTVLDNLNSQHCKYVDLTTKVNEVLDYLTRTRENISEVISRLELEDEERARHNKRIINNSKRLKDLKNEFNQTQSELSKCLNTVQNNIQQTNSLGYVEIHTCNDLLISVAEEVEQIVDNLRTFQTQGVTTLSTMTELKKQLTAMEHSIKGLKKKSDQVLLENEAAQKSFKDRSKCLEKYECQIDNCHTKMQDVLDSIIAIRNQMNEFGCIKETENPFESTNETIKMKDDMRKLHEECKKLKLRISQNASTVEQDETVSKCENTVISLQDEIKVLQNEIKCKQTANISLKQTIDSLEEQLYSIRAKAEEYRRCSSIECLELKNRVFELENSLKVQKDTENNLNCLANNETDSKKSQFLDYINKDRLLDSTLKHGLQGSHENIPQLFKVLQDKIQATKDGLQELDNKFKRLIPEGSSHSPSNTTNSVKSTRELLGKYVESIEWCSFEVKKMKAALNSTDKLMENMQQIIRIQKDSITISQTEVEDLHKDLQEKIEAQEKAISQCEKEKRKLTKEIEHQVQTIGHLQNAVVEAKRTIDQLSSKATSDVSEPWTSVSPTVSNHRNVHDI